MLEPGGCHFGCPMAGMGPRGAGTGRIPCVGDERRADPTIREVEWFREMVFEYFVARLSRRTVGFGGISPIFTPTADGCSKKRIYWPRWPTQWPVHCADSDTQAPCQLLLG